jgi:hypothetical protein
VLWLIMVLVYYFLARDEERRMLNDHEATYSAYRGKTGMFLPRHIEQSLTPSTAVGKILLALVFTALVIGAPFLLRAHTVKQLTLWAKSPNVTGVAILPEDGFKMDHRMGDILALKEVKEHLQDNKQYLVYFIPQDYIMQGMIADTGGDWKLYNQHHSLFMISDWVFHPFRHLREGHHAMHGSMQMQHHGNEGMEGGVVRRLIFLSIEDVDVKSPDDLFSINALRVPQFMVDVDVHTVQLFEVKYLAHGSGWRTLPTPVF